MVLAMAQDLLLSTAYASIVLETVSRNPLSDGFLAGDREDCKMKKITARIAYAFLAVSAIFLAKYLIISENFMLNNP